VDRLIEVNLKALRLGEKVYAAKREQRDQHQRHCANDKHADDGGTDLGFHG
jgi:hypothetical protein